MKFVVNYDYPNCSEDYVHRIGRTARAENTGTAYTFFTQENMKNARDLVAVLEEANQEIPVALMQLVGMAKDFGRGKSNFLHLSPPVQVISPEASGGYFGLAFATPPPRVERFSVLTL